MDWRRAITILIVSFIALNLFLGLNLWSKARPTAEFTLTPDEESEIKHYLSQKGVQLKSDIPKEGKAQALLEIGFEKINENNVVENFFGKDQVKMSQTQNGRSYTLDNRQLIITDNGFITYFNNEGKVIFPQLTKEQAETEAVNFIKNHGGMPEQAVLNKVTFDEHSKGYLLEYVRYYDGFFIDNSYITILVTPSGIKSYYQCWLEPFGYVGKKRGVISPLTAVLRIITEVEEDPVVITRIQQGYNSKLYDADRWQAAPVWKIELENGDRFYVNAYTGELEQ